MNFLVAYATCHGSTAEIASRIATRLESVGDTTDCRSVGEIAHLSEYHAAVIGSAVHDHAWLPEAIDFLTQHASTLKEIPTWLFSVGMPAALPNRLQGLAMQEESQITDKLSPLLHPREHRLFSGAIYKEHLTTSGRVTFRVMGGHYGDFRNWVEIDAWADTIASNFHPAQ